MKIVTVCALAAVAVLLAAGNSVWALNLNVPVEGFNGEKPVVNMHEVRMVLPYSVPEPNTVLLLFSGIAGIVVRFMRKSFNEIKRLIDIVLSIIGLTVALPLLAYAAFMIRFDSPGPVIYRQRRVGKNGRMFCIYKLRTMRRDAEHGTGAVWAKRNDPRITAVGGVLRKLRIDEIPQLYNVLRGEMSIIGPRPERPEIVERLRGCICGYESRLGVEPGITGLAQVLYKYDETLDDVKEKVKFDQLYMQSMSLATDLRILARTFVVVATGKGAH